MYILCLRNKHFNVRYILRIKHVKKTKCFLMTNKNFNEQQNFSVFEVN